MLSYWTIRTAVRSVNMCWSRTGYRERAGIPDAIATARKFRFVENLVLFISIVAECLLIAINFQVDREVAWSLVIGIILLYGNVVLRMAILGKSGYLAKTALSGTSCHCNASWN